ncbi:MAG: NAD-binding protein [Thomasclavelia sp.]|jgi:trk system potassium uptake protein TrkA|nr:NAD-binding protein [Thomasclavelia sp.]
MILKQREKDRILIVGGYHKTQSLAKSLIKKGYKVTAINKDLKKCEKLAEIENLNTIYGDGSKKFILEDADASRNKVMIVLTDNDECNLVICQMGKQIFHIQKTVCLLNDPKKAEFFYEMGVDRVVCAMNMITNIMEEHAIMNEMTKMIPIEEGRIQIVELRVSNDAPIIGKRLWELNFPKEIIIGCVLRGEQSLIPRGDTRLMAGDNLLIISSDKEKIVLVKEQMGYDEK